MPEMNYYYNQSHPLKPFTGQCLANPGSYPPDGAVRFPPPSGYPQGKHPAFKDGSWVLIDDHRNESGYVNGQPFTIKDYGPYPDGWSTTPPPPTPEQIKQEAINQCLGKLAELDAKSTRTIRSIEVLRYRQSNGENVTSELASEIAFLGNLENQAQETRAELAALRESNVTYN
jgi:hypothetical protein